MRSTLLAEPIGGLIGKWSEQPRSRRRRPEIIKSNSHLYAIRSIVMTGFHT